MGRSFFLREKPQFGYFVIVIRTLNKINLIDTWQSNELIYTSHVLSVYFWARIYYAPITCTYEFVQCWLFRLVYKEGGVKYLAPNFVDNIHRLTEFSDVAFHFQATSCRGLHVYLLLCGVCPGEFLSRGFMSGGFVRIFVLSPIIEVTLPVVAFHYVRWALV